MAFEQKSHLLRLDPFDKLRTSTRSSRQATDLVLRCEYKWKMERGWCR